MLPHTNASRTMKRLFMQLEAGRGSNKSILAFWDASIRGGVLARLRELVEIWGIIQGKVQA
ncbi:hypothetical protein KY289_019597 [Solanum tuberosum]|nr:hypothetical protein KY289_019597 [Solanum tuberosum]